MWAVLATPLARLTAAVAVCTAVPTCFRRPRAPDAASLRRDVRVRVDHLGPLHFQRKPPRARRAPAPPRSAQQRAASAAQRSSSFTGRRTAVHTTARRKVGGRRLGHRGGFRARQSLRRPLISLAAARQRKDVEERKRPEVRPWAHREGHRDWLAWPRRGGFARKMRLGRRGTAARRWARSSILARRSARRARRPLAPIFRGGACPRRHAARSARAAARQLGRKARERLWRFARGFFLCAVLLCGRGLLSASRAQLVTDVSSAFSPRSARPA